MASSSTGAGPASTPATGPPSSTTGPQRKRVRKDASLTSEDEAGASAPDPKRARRPDATDRPSGAGGPPPGPDPPVDPPADPPADIGVRIHPLYRMPNEMWDAVIRYCGQSAAHSLARTSRAMYWICSPLAWRKVVLAPNPEWVAHSERPHDSFPWNRRVGQVCRGFLRGERLINSYMRDFANGAVGGQSAAWSNLLRVEELVICEILPTSGLYDLFRMLPNVRKTKIYMGNFLHYYRESLSNGYSTNWTIHPHLIPPNPPEPWRGQQTRGARPRMLCESVATSMNNNGLSWNSLNITHLDLDCEAHILPNYDTTRYHFVDQLYAVYRLNNRRPQAFFDSFPNIQTLVCGSWFLELLWDATYLQNLWHGRMRDRTDEDIIAEINDKGIGRLDKHDYWTQMHSLTVRGYEGEHPEIMYHSHRSIIAPHIWTFLGTFRGLKTIKAELGPWKRCHRYPGGFDLVPHIESFETLAALQICQRIHGWNVEIERFIVNLRDLENITTIEDDEGELEPDIPTLPYLSTSEQLAKLLDFIATVGWTGHISVPDATNWWNGPTWKFWIRNAVAPDNNLTVESFFPDVVNPIDHRWIPWRRRAGDIETTDVRTLLLSYIEALVHSQDWKQKNPGLYIYHETCWYRNHLPPRFRYMSPAQYNSQLVDFLRRRIPLLKELIVSTNNWNKITDEFSALDDHITEVYYDGFEYRVTGLIENPDVLEAEGKPRLALSLHHTRSDDFDAMADMKNLKVLAIVNVQWPFDLEKAGKSSPQQEVLSFEDFDPDAFTQQNIEDVPSNNPLLKKIKLYGDVFFRVPEGWGSDNKEPFIGSQTQRENARRAIYAAFQDPKIEEKLDLSWLRFKYVPDEAFQRMIYRKEAEDPSAPTVVEVLYERNDLPAFNRYPTWDTYDEIDMYNEVETQGWKVHQEGSNYAVFVDRGELDLELGAPAPGFKNSVEEKMQAWSMQIHPEKDVPFDPVTLGFYRYHESPHSRFRALIGDFYFVHANAVA